MLPTGCPAIQEPVGTLIAVAAVSEPRETSDTTPNAAAAISTGMTTASTIPRRPSAGVWSQWA